MEVNDFNDEFSLSSYQSDSDDDYKQTIEELKKENESLKKQFESALLITSNLEEIQNKNKELTTALRKETSSRIELENRIEFMLKTNKELEQKLNEQKKDCESSSISKTESQNKILVKTKGKYEEQIKSLQDKLNDAKKQSKEQMIAAKTVESSISKLLMAAKRVYNADLSSVNELTSMLDSMSVNSGVIPVKQEEEQSRNKTLHDEIEEQNIVDSMKKKMKKQKEKNFILSEENKKLQELLESKNSIINEMKNTEKRDIKDAQTEIANKQEEFLVKELNYKNTIKSLTLRNENLREDLARLNNELKIAKEQANRAPIELPKQEIKEAKKRPDAFQVMHEQYMQRINDLSNQVNEQRQKKDEIFEESRKKQVKIVELESSLSKYQKQNEENEKRCQDSENEVRELKFSLDGLMETEQKNAKLLQRIKTLKQMVIKMDTQIQKQTGELKDNEIEIKKRENEIKEKSQTVERLEKDNNKQREEIEELKSSILKLHDENSNINEPQEIEIPIHVFSSLPYTVITKCESVVNNQMMQLPTKLQNILRFVVEHYNEQIKDIENQLEENEKQNLQAIKAVDEFITNVSIASIDKPVTYTTLFQDGNDEAIVTEINDLRKQLLETQSIAEALGNIIEKFNNTIGGGDEDMFKVIDDIKETFEDKKRIIMKKSKKCKSLKNQIVSLKTEADHQIAELQLENNNLKGENEELTKELEDVNKEKQNLLIKNTNLQNDKQNLENELKESKEMADNNAKQLEERFRKQHDSNKGTYDKNNAALLDEIKKLKENICKLVRQEERYKKLINEQIKKIEEKEKEANDIKRSKEEIIEELTHKNEEEKKNIKEVYEDAISKLKLQCEQVRNDSDQLSDQLSESVQVNSKLQHKLEKAVGKLRISENKATALEEEMHREKLLLESTKRAQIVMQEAKKDEEISKVKDKYERDNRKLYLYIIEMFKQHFRPTDSIEYSSITKLLKNASQELSRLEKAESSIKSLLNANDGQTLEDAVSQVFFDLNNSKL